MYKNLINYLINPIDNSEIFYDELKNIFKSKNHEFLVENDIPNFYINEDIKDPMTKIQKEFYQKVIFPNYDEFDNFGSLIEKAEKSAFAKMLDEQIPYNSNILEIGCGTGQMSIFLSRKNRLVIGTDIAKSSLILGNEFKKENNINNIYFLQMNLFNPFIKPNIFDFVISNGCLHHTSDPKKAFVKISKLVKKNGFIIIGLYHKYGRLITNLRQIIINLFGDNFKFIDKRNINKKISQEKRYAWFNDQYKNPKESSHTYYEILKWFEESNIEYISSIPFDDFSGKFELFKKRKKKSKMIIKLNEISMIISKSQIREGGFFYNDRKEKII